MNQQPLQITEDQKRELLGAASADAVGSKMEQMAEELVNQRNDLHLSAKKMVRIALMRGYMMALENMESLKMIQFPEAKKEESLVVVP
jgi:hypothetical protein